MAEARKPKSILLLSGGGFKGAVQVPVIEHLLHRSYDLILGTSVGSLNGFLAAQRDIGAMWDLWRKVDGKSAFLDQHLIPAHGIFSLAPTEKLVEKYLNPLRFVSAFGCGICNRETGEHFTPIFDNSAQKDRVRNSILASCAIAGVMDPITLKEGMCSDGGHLHVVPPVPREFVDSIEHIDAVFCSPLTGEKQPQSKVNGLLEAMLWAVDTASLAVRRADVELLQDRVTTRCAVVVYAPQESTGELLDASKETIAKRFQIGRKMLSNPMVL